MTNRNEGGDEPERLSVIGLGKLGSCMAAVFAAQGYEVVGLDVDPDTVEAVAQGRAPVPEPQLQDTIDRAEGRLTATLDYEEAVQGTDASFIIVPTPSKDDGSFALDYVLDAGRSIGKALAKKEGYHLVVLTSTVLPGSTQHGLQEVIEEASGKECGEDFGLCYSPEFIALGSVIQDMLEPDMVLIGESDSHAGDLLARIYQRTCTNDPPIQRMNFVNAELAKIALNTFVTTKITFANILAETCENLPGADVDDVTRALGKDTRIGPTYIKGSVGYGGPCFPRDNVALSYLLDG
ncbi:MAG: nucleotide sugar dehydrogenase, partial [Candidatus Thermoplasmatota archaeon]|nr:nucleotide sugar dehydrogenase [Candidatus Thermoplasmatota archaeon]